MTLAALALSALFMVALVWRRLQQWLASRALLFLGLLSYPLYLSHENLMLASIVKIGQLGGGVSLMPPWTYALWPLLGLLAFAYGCVAVAEPAIRHLIDRRWLLRDRVPA